MNYLLLFLFLLLGSLCSAQTRKKATQKTIDVKTYDIWIGKIKQSDKGKPSFSPITDSIAVLDSSTKKGIIKLIYRIAENGTEDISKCFIPRDVVVIHKNKKPFCTLYICFECEGFRIMGDSIKVSSKTPSIDKRTSQLSEVEKMLNKLRK